MEPVRLGLMGGGKTSVGRRVAERLGRPLLDGDEVLEARFGQTVQKDHRPLLDDGDPLALFERQLATRGPVIRAVADLVVDVETTSKDDQADAVVALVQPDPVTEG